MLYSTVDIYMYAVVRTQDAGQGVRIKLQVEDTFTNTNQFQINLTSFNNI